MRIRNLIQGDRASAAFVSSDTRKQIDLIPVFAWGVVDFGGESTQIHGFVIREGAVVDADECDDFCGYAYFGDDYQRSVHACLRQADIKRSQKKEGH